MHLIRYAPHLLILIAAPIACRAQAAHPVRSESPSSITVTGPPGESTIEIHNVSYEIAAPDLPGRPKNQLLTLRKTVHSKQAVDEIGIEATTTLEAWPLGGDLKQRPIYSLTVSGTGGHTLDEAVFVVSRGLEEVEWWSVYKLGTAEHLFDSYVPVLGFSISKTDLIRRYVGLQVPEDDTRDARLKQPGIVAVLTYASAARVIREALITCDDARRAQLLRSLADATRTVSIDDEARTLRISFRQSYPPAALGAVRVPIASDDLDLARAQLPPGMHISGWKR